MKTPQSRLLLYAFSFCAFFHCASSPAQSNSDAEEPETISFRWDSQGKMRPVAGKNVSWQNALMEDSRGGEEVRFWTTGEGRGGYRMYGTRGGVEGTWRTNAQAGSGSIYVRRANESTDRTAYIFQSGDAVTIWGLSDPNGYMRYRILEPGQTWEEAVKTHLQVNTYSSQFSLEYNITKVDETDEEVVFAFDCTARYPAKLKPATLADTGIEEKTKPILYEGGFAPIHGGLYEIAYFVDNAPVVSQRQGNVFVQPNREADEAQLGVKSNDDTAPFFRLKGGGRATRYEESWTVNADYENIEKNPGWSSVSPLVALDSPEVQDILDRYLSGLGQMAEKLRGALAFIGSTWHFAADPNSFAPPWFKEFTITSSWNMEDLPSRGSFQRLFAQQGADELLAAIAQIEKDSWETNALRQSRGLNAERISVTPGKPIYALININGELRAAVGRPTYYRDFAGPLAVTFVFRREPRGHPSIESIVLIFYPDKDELWINDQHQLTRTDVDKLFVLHDTNSTLDTNESQTDQGNVTGGAPVPVLAIPSIPPSDSGSMQKEQRFVAVKVLEEGGAVNVRIHDTKKKDWLDENTFRLEPEPALGEILELDGVRAVYVGRQDFGSSPSASPTPGAVSETSLPYPVSGAVVRIDNVRLDDAVLEGTPTKDLRFQVVAAGTSLPEGEAVRVNVVFYDTADGTVTPTDKPVSSLWVDPPVDWNDNGLEELIITCVQAPDGTGSPPVPAYLGYAITLYYRGSLQDAKAAPADLLQAFPPPKSYQYEAQAPPSFAAPAIASASPGSKKAPPAAAAVSQPLGQQTVQEGLEKNIQALMSSPRLQEIRKQTRYIAVDVPPDGRTPAGTKAQMVLDLETGRLVGNTVYNVKVTPTPTPKPKSKTAITTRYIARVVPPTAKSPRGTFQLMIFDRDTGRPATKLVYNVKRIPETGAQVTFDNNIIATFVNP